jgi:hypothetical protein
MLQIKKITRVFYLQIILFSLLTFSCSSIKILREFHDPAQLHISSSNTKSMKVHMKDGTLYMLEKPFMNASSDTISGYGSFYNQYREIALTNISPEGLRIPPGFQIALSDVALFETNDITGLNGKVLALTVVGIPTAIISVYCIINPKACFGSCPTFYCWNGEDTVLMAEGFSSSILKSLEKEDIDMLYHAKASGNVVNLKLTNEALETHVIRYADLLVFHRKENERVFADGQGSFTRVSDIRSPSSCVASEGDCLEAVKQMDQKERYSETGARNLAEKEFIDVNFDSVPDGEIGLIIGNRQTFLTTFLFYQTLAYLGNTAGYFAASIENGNKSLKKDVNRIREILGGIDVSIQDQGGKWVRTGKIDEEGPIASDVHLLRLPVTGRTNLKIRLELTKGLWRIDYLALAKLGQSVEPVRIKPSVLPSKTETCNNSRNLILSDTLDPLVTLPGDSYNLSYCLPVTSDDYELFLCSKGYYIEWMREPWLEEENHRKATFMFGFPGLFMKMAAREFKSVESSMEENFWKSRYVKKD